MRSPILTMFFQDPTHPQEVRIEDYIKAYQATGRPPVPVPQEPADELARKALNLPPLFKPYSVPSTSSSSVALVSTAQRITDPTQLPPAQEFRLRSTDSEKYHDISCMTEYEFFSHEVRFGMVSGMHQEGLGSFILGIEILCLLGWEY